MKKKENNEILIHVDNLKVSRWDYYGLCVAIAILIIMFIATIVFADNGKTYSKGFSENMLLQLIIFILTGILAYFAWTIKRFITKIDDGQKLLREVVAVLIGIATEHKSNHESCVNFDALMKGGD